jgi:hypothetical protein
VLGDANDRLKMWFGRTIPELSTSEIVTIMTHPGVTTDDHRALADELDRRIPIPCVCNPDVTVQFVNGIATSVAGKHKDTCPARFR